MRYCNIAHLFFLSIFLIFCISNKVFGQDIPQTGLSPVLYFSNSDKLSENKNFLLKKFPTDKLYQFKSNNSNITSNTDFKEIPSVQNNFQKIYNTNNTNRFSKSIHSFASFSTIASTDSIVPFWMRSLKYGSIPLAGISVSGIGGIRKDYNPENTKKFDWGASFEGRINAGNTIEAILIEAYAKARFSIFQLKAGRSKEMMGLVDSTLSSGAFSISGNALGIPKIELSIPEYWNIPFTNGLFAIKGNFAHGWMGKQELSDKSFIDVPYVTSFLHQKSLYGKFGKPNWKVNLFAGFNHQVMWGNEGEIRKDCDLSLLETYKYVVFGQVYNYSKVGNHVGSIDQALEIKFKNFNLTGYHQFFYEAGALASLDNVKDGIYGLSYKNKSDQNSILKFEKIVFEFIYSKSQGGEVDSKSRKSGYEDYYNNFMFENGWSYQEENIGNPLLTSKNYIRTDLPQDSLYFPNNRVVAFHLGLHFSYLNWQVKTVLSTSQNYGNYATSPAYHAAGNEIAYNNPPYFGKVNQFSAALEVLRKLKNDFHLCFEIGFDHGKVLYNSFGGEVKLVKHW